MGFLSTSGGLDEVTARSLQFKHLAFLTFVNAAGTSG